MSQSTNTLVWVTVGAFVLSATYCAIMFARGYRQYKALRVVFPPLDPQKVRFHEAGASGHSNKSMSERFGGASNCLSVTVTDAEVWLRILFPFNVVAFMRHSDLECRIAKTSIVNVQPTRSRFMSSVLLSYRDEEGTTHSFSLKLRKPDEFVRAALASSVPTV
jgi:hypothetical protein